MKENIRTYVQKTCLIYLLILTGTPFFLAEAQENNYLDQTPSTEYNEDISQHRTPIYELRSFDKEIIDQYKSNKDFDYSEIKQQASLLKQYWNRFKRWLAMSVNKGVSSDKTRYLLMFLAVGILIYALRKSNYQEVFSTKKQLRPTVSELDIQVDEDVLQDRLKLAENKNDYKEAIRLQYLIILKNLDAKSIIQWRPYKLSDDYIAEIKDPNFVQPFQRLTYFFNYVWYGEKKTDSESYAEVKKLYSSTFQKIANV